MEKKVITVILLSIVLASCATPTVVRTQVLVPAKSSEATKLRQIAVLPFEGPEGRQLADDVESMLSQVRVGDKPYFTVVDRSRTDKLIREMQISQSALFDPRTASQLGRMVGVKGVYTGSVSRARTADSHYSESRRSCVSRQTKYDKKGNPYDAGCASYQDYSVSCTRRTGTFSFTPKLIEVETGKIVYSNTISETKVVSACSDRGTLVDNDELIRMLKTVALRRFQGEVAPIYTTMVIQIMETDDSLPSKDAAAKLQQGVDYGKNGRLDRACELWAEGDRIYSSSASITYNLGVCAEATGDLKQALELYKKSDRILNKPDNRITAALGRVEKALADQQKLRTQTGDTKKN